MHNLHVSAVKYLLPDLHKSSKPPKLRSIWQWGMSFAQFMQIRQRICNCTDVQIMRFILDKIMKLLTVTLVVVKLSELKPFLSHPVLSRSFHVLKFRQSLRLDMTCSSSCFWNVKFKKNKWIKIWNTLQLLKFVEICKFRNKNLAMANRARVICAHNTLRALIGLNITPWPWNLG